MIYFISGHRDLSYEDFEKYYIPVISKVCIEDPDAHFVVGDCDGADKFAMDYIFSNYNVPLVIYYAFNAPRNVPKGLSENPEMEGVYFKGGFSSHEEKDAAMTEASDLDIAFVKNNRWNSGTAKNIRRRHSI